MVGWGLRADEPGLVYLPRTDTEMAMLRAKALQEVEMASVSPSPLGPYTFR